MKKKTGGRKFCWTVHLTCTVCREREVAWYRIRMEADDKGKVVEKDEFNLFFQIDRGKTASAARN